MKKVISVTLLVFLVGNLYSSTITSYSKTLPNSNPETELTALKEIFYPNDNELIFLGKYEDDQNRWFSYADTSLNQSFSIADYGCAYLVNWDLTDTNFEVWGIVVKNGGQIKNRILKVDEEYRLSREFLTLKSASWCKDISHVSFFGKRRQINRVDDDTNFIIYGFIFIVLFSVLATLLAKHLGVRE